MGIPKCRPIKFIVSRLCRFSKVWVGTRQKTIWLVSNRLFSPTEYKMSSHEYLRPVNNCHYFFLKAAGKTLLPPESFSRIRSPSHSGSARTVSQILVSFPIVYLALGKTAVRAWIYASITGVISLFRKPEVSMPFIFSTTATKVSSVKIRPHLPTDHRILWFPVNKFQMARS